MLGEKIIFHIIDLILKGHSLRQSSDLFFYSNWFHIIADLWFEQHIVYYT